MRRKLAEPKLHLQASNEMLLMRLKRYTRLNSHMPGAKASILAGLQDIHLISERGKSHDAF
jgi:hypothetical protein